MMMMRRWRSPWSLLEFIACLLQVSQIFLYFLKLNFRFSLRNWGLLYRAFPRAYHSGFNCSFNCAEAVKVAPMDWLPQGQSTVELYSEQWRKTSVSHDKLLIRAEKEAERGLWEIPVLEKLNPDNLRWQCICEDGVLTSAIKERVEMEKKRRGCLSCTSEARKMDTNFDSWNERECYSYFYDLHLSAAGCECSPKCFSCLSRAKDLCSCEPECKFFIFRYSMDELNTLVKALEVDLSAVRQWGLEVLSLVPPSTSNDFVEKQLDINMMDAIDSYEDNGNKVHKNVVLEPKKSKAIYFQHAEVGSRRLSSVTDGKSFTDLNTKQLSTESKSSTLDSNGNSKIEELPVTPLRLSPECGSSVSRNHSSELVSCSKGVPHTHKSSAK